MALFGGGNAQQGLALTVSAFGTEETAGKLNRVAGAAGKVDRAAKGAASGGASRLSAGLTRVRGMATGLIGTLGKLGGMLGIGGVFAMSGLITEEVEVERNLHRIQFQAGLGAKEMDKMRQAMNSISAATGKSRGEIVSAIDTAMDLGIPLEEASEWMEKIVLWSDLVGVNVEQATGAVAGIKRAVGDAVDIPTIMGMMTAAAQNAGMKEEDLFNMVAKVASQLEGVESVEDINAFFQAIAGLGGDFAGDPEKLQEAFKALNRQMGNKKFMEGLRTAGVEGKNSAEMLRSMAQILARDERGLDNAGLPAEVLAIALAMSGNIPKMDAMGTAVDNAAGSTEELFAAIEAHKKDPEIAWSATMQELKQAMQPFVSDVLGWITGHSDEIIAAFQTLGAMAGWVGEQFAALVAFIRALIDEFRGGPPVNTGLDVTDEGKAADVFHEVRRMQAAGQDVGPTLTAVADAYEARRDERMAALNPGYTPPVPGSPTAPAPASAPTRVDGQITVRTVEGVAVDADLRVDGRSAESVVPAG